MEALEGVRYQKLSESSELGGSHTKNVNVTMMYILSDKLVTWCRVVIHICLFLYKNASCKTFKLEKIVTILT